MSVVMPDPWSQATHSPNRQTPQVASPANAPEAIRQNADAWAIYQKAGITFLLYNQIFEYIRWSFTHCQWIVWSSRDHDQWTSENRRRSPVLAGMYPVRVASDEPRPPGPIPRGRTPRLLYQMIKPASSHFPTRPPARVSLWVAGWESGSVMRSKSGPFQCVRTPCRLSGGTSRHSNFAFDNLNVYGWQTARCQM